ncbi:hypothetical protein LCGC14_2681720, partial [marine sediment metagenome]
MPKFEKKIERSHEKDCNRARDFFFNLNYKEAERLFLKCYKFYVRKNQLKKAYEALEKYIISLINMGHNQKALPKVNEILEYSISTKNKKFKAFAYGSKGIILKSMGNFAESLNITKKAKRLFKELNNQEDLKRTYVNIGNTYYFQGNYLSSLKNYKKAEKICIENNILNGLSGVYQFIAFCYLGLNSLEKFKKYNEKIFEFFNHVTDLQNQAEILNNLCIPSFYSNEISEDLITFLVRLLKDCNKLNLNTQKVKTLRNLGGISMNQKKYSEAKNYLNQALDISEGLNFEIDKAYIYNNIGQVFYRE